jgi:Protein of unknown function (DUF3634)
MAHVIFLAVVLLVAWVLLKPTPAFVIRIENGVARAAWGRVPAAFLWELNTTCQREQIQEGVIRGLRFRYGVLLQFSRSIARERRQGIRNLWALHR